MCKTTDTAGDTRIDVYDIGSGMTTYDLASFPHPSSPVGITDGPDDRLYVVGAGSLDAAAWTVVNPDTGAVVNTNIFMDFAGSNVRLTNLVIRWRPNMVPIYLLLL